MDYTQLLDERISFHLFIDVVFGDSWDILKHEASKQGVIQDMIEVPVKMLFEGTQT